MSAENGPWTCYLLETVPERTADFGAYLKDSTQICPVSGHPHRASMDVPYEADLYDLKPDAQGFYAFMGQRLTCACGLQFEPQTSSVFGSRSTASFRNPKTGQSSSRPHTIAGYGAMWFCPWLIERGDYDKVMSGKSAFMSSRYARDWWGKRDPICVMLPGGLHWVVDAPTSNGGPGSGWDVTGEAPNITVNPSILTPEYHGWLHNGVLSTDLDGGRSYTPRN